MVFLKLAHTEYQVNHITQPFWVKVVQCSNPSWACFWHHPFGTNNYPQFGHSTKNQVFIFALHFLFFAKIMLEITNTYRLDGQKGAFFLVQGPVQGT